MITMSALSFLNRDQLVLASLILFVLKCVNNTHAEVNKVLEVPFSINDFDEEIDSITDSGPSQLLTNEDLDKASDVLVKLLLMPWPKGESPLIYMETPEVMEERLQNNLYNEYHLKDIENANELKSTGVKRSKYYRKYPWKRQQSNMRYDPAYMCIPNKDDVYRLLVAIHGERDGYKGQLVDFCNRKRPASLVFTNIRYIG